MHFTTSTQPLHGSRTGSVRFSGNCALNFQFPYNLRAASEWIFLDQFPDSPYEHCTILVYNVKTYAASCSYLPEYCIRSLRTASMANIKKAYTRKFFQIILRKAHIILQPALSLPLRYEFTSLSCSDIYLGWRRDEYQICFEACISYACIKI